MSRLHINQFSSSDRADAVLLIASMPVTAQQNVTFSTAASVPCDTAAPGRQIWQLVSDADCYVEFAESPTASITTSMYLPAGVYYEAWVAAGTKVAVIGK